MLKLKKKDTVVVLAGKDKVNLNKAYGGKVLQLSVGGTTYLTESRRMPGLIDDAKDVLLMLFDDTRQTIPNSFVPTNGEVLEQQLFCVRRQQQQRVLWKGMEQCLCIGGRRHQPGKKILRLLVCPPR